MFKYSFYTMTLRKFEVDQYQSIEDTQLLKSYMMYKTGVYDPNVKEEILVKKMEKLSDKAFNEASKLDDLLENMNDEEFELVPTEKKSVEERDNNGSNTALK